MQESELRNQEWDIAANCQRSELNTVGLTLDEQKFYIKKGIFGISFSCSSQADLTRLAKSGFVTIESYVVSTINKGFILQVSGKMDKKAITIRNAERKVSDELKAKLSQRMRKKWQEKQND
jgi:hypothetical protein